MKRRNCRASRASSTDLPAPVGPTTRRVADIADMQIEPERRAAARLRHHQRRRVQVPVGLRPRPHGRDRHHVSEIEGVHDRLAHIGVGVAGQAAEPGLDRVQGLADGDEAAPVDDALDGQQLIVGLLGIGVGNDRPWW